jgi:hypothetical protein
MILNPKYGSLAFLTLPYYLLYEVWGVFFEVISIAFVAAGWLTGLLDPKIFLAFISFMVLSQALISELSIFAFIRGQRIFRLGYICYLMLLGLFEFILYRWIISLSKLIGTYNYLQKIRVFNQYPRAKRAKA